MSDLLRLTVHGAFSPSPDAVSRGERRAAARRIYPTWLIVAFIIAALMTAIGMVAILFAPFFHAASPAVALGSLIAIGLLALSLIVQKASRIRERH